jgi:hypothetical protein
MDFAFDHRIICLAVAFIASGSSEDVNMQSLVLLSSGDSYGLNQNHVFYH